MKELVIKIINILLASLNERSYILQLKKVVNQIDSDDEDLMNVKRLLNTITKHNIENKTEALVEIAELFDSSITSVIKIKTAPYSVKYKENFLKSLNIERFISVVDSLNEKINDDLIKMKSTTDNPNLRSKLMEVIEANSKELYDKINSMKVSSAASKVIILDPRNQQLTVDNLMPVITESRDIGKSTIKTFPAFDIVTGGVKLGTSTLIVAKSAGFKSGTLQNICISATLNNDPSSFNVPPGKIPTVFLFSMENTRRQLYERNVSYFFDSQQEARSVTDNMTTEQMGVFINKLFTDAGVKLPLIYVDRVSEEQTTISDIATIISEYEELGYYPILLGIDYLTKLTPDNPEFRRYSNSGAEGSKKQQMKSEEIRKYLVSKNIAGIIPEQLSSDAVKRIEDLRPYCRKIDPLFHTSMDMISGSRNLNTEYDNVIFIYKSEITDLEQDGETLTRKEFISFINKKEREQSEPYTLSPRDKINSSLYELQVRKIKNGPHRDKFLDTGERHVVAPLINYKISLDDYAKSIIMYFTSDNTDSMDLKTLMDTSTTILTDVKEVLETNDITNELGL